MDVLKYILTLIDIDRVFQSEIQYILNMLRNSNYLQKGPSYGWMP